VAAGFSPDDITCNVNVYTPRVTDNPENAWRLVQLVKHGYGSTSLTVRNPVISGKDSSSGTFQTASGELIHAPLTLAVLALGRMPCYQRLIPKAFSRPGDRLILYYPGIKEMNLGGSILLDLYGQRGDKLPEVDLSEVRAGWERYHSMLKKFRWSRYIHSRSVVAEAGLIRRLFEMSIGNNFGCQIILPGDPMHWLFAELHTAILFTTSSPSCIKSLGDNCSIIGEVIDEPQINVSVGSQKLFSATLEQLSEKWSKTSSEVAL
jgi:phosphoribosylformylglycinamidine (FGAM) synthase-like enzyme